MIKNYFMISFLTFPRTYLAWCIENAKIIKIKLFLIKSCGVFFYKAETELLTSNSLDLKGERNQQHFHLNPKLLISLAGEILNISV